MTAAIRSQAAPANGHGAVALSQIAGPSWLARFRFHWDSRLAPRPNRPAASHPPAPREHGAWGILLIPFAIAVGVAGTWTLPLALLLASVLSFYVARTSWLKRNFYWTITLLSISAICALPLVWVWQLGWLLLFGGVGLAVGFRPTSRGIPAQLLAVVGLTLTAPAAWYTATGRLDTMAAVLWLLNALYFGTGVFYVKLHIAAAMRRSPFRTLAERLAFGKQVLLIHVALIGLVAGLLVATAIPFLVVLAFLPAVVRAFGGIARLSPKLRIKRLGWSEVAYSIAYAIVLIAAFQMAEVI